MRRFQAFLFLLVLTSGCGESTAPPLAPSTIVTPSTVVVPPPRVAPPSMLLEVGVPVFRVIDETPPDCVEYSGWPCQYFRITPSRSGTLFVELTYVPDTQPPGKFPGPQPVDVSVFGRNVEVWSEFRDRTTTRVTLPVTGDVEYQITLWYTFPKLAYELRAALTN
jgi:hypothetical protein